MPDTTTKQPDVSRQIPVRVWRPACAAIGEAVCVVPRCSACWWPLPNTEPRVCIHCGNEADRG